MRCGTELVAPEGYRSLRADEAYYLLRNRNDGRVLLLKFVGGAEVAPAVTLVQMSQMEFEDGIEAGCIVESQHQRSLPPWLDAFENVDLAKLDLRRPRARKSHASRVENRLLIILPALAETDRILLAADPDEELNKLARVSRPRQNERRFRLWFYTYICFGRNTWALLPPFHNIGRHDRLDFPDSKQGRKNKAFGEHYGFGCRQDVIDACIRGWVKHSQLGRTMKDIFRRTMTTEFHCRVAKTHLGTDDYVQPEGKPIPTYWQFRYRVHQKFGLSLVQVTLYGDVRHRARLAPSEGAFAEAVANLTERVEADAYNTPERPKGFIEGRVLPPLSVVIGRDCLSGMKLGIGFSFGAERMSAYRAMLFCMAVPKDFFCSLFGITISRDDWPNEGLPPYLIVDRGPGATKGLVEEAVPALAIREIAPSWSAQSKATVESSHPRNIKIEGAPTYIQSELTPVELAKQEIYRLVNYNHTADMSDRFQPAGDLAHVLPNPVGFWNYYDARGRNDATFVAISNAVRAFLIPIELTVTEKGVWLREQHYSSDALRATGILDRVKRSPRTAIKCPGYMLEMAVRYIWIDIEGRLVMVGAQLRHRDDETLLDLSHQELEQWHEARSVIASAFAVHQDAATTEMMQAFEKDVGKRWEAGRIRRGKPKEDAISRREYEEAKAYTSGGKQAA